MAEKFPGSEMADLNSVPLSDEDREINALVHAQEAGKIEPEKPIPCGGDEIFVVESVRKWKELTSFTVPYVEKTPWKDYARSRSIFEDAQAKAADFFVEAYGALYLPTFPESAVEVHLHPFALDMFNRLAPQVVFLFKRAIAGTPRECAIPYMLSPQQIGFLKTTGRWPKAN